MYIKEFLSALEENEVMVFSGKQIEIIMLEKNKPVLENYCMSLSDVEFIMKCVCVCVCVIVKDKTIILFNKHKINKIKSTKI